ncbi:MAG TPA: hypothetical protein VLT33_51265 [Labilithrix sp.]|nr:hypothetical protein [Labilithrix sp.]
MLSRTRFLRASALAGVLAASTFAVPAAAQVETTPDLTPGPAPEPAAPAPVAPAPAAASDDARVSEPAPSATTAGESYWYGWQIMIADAASIATMAAGGAMGSSTVGVIGVGGYFVAAPVVHGVQGRTGVAFGSFGLRAGMPMLGGFIGYAAAGSCSADERSAFLGCLFHGWAEAMVGGLIGAAGAIVLDTALLAQGTHKVAQPRETGVPKVTSLAPSFDPRTGAASMGLGGTF